MLRAFDLASLPAVAWRNGLGSARTLAVWPPEETDSLRADAFAWRVGTAEIEPGRVAFSRFAGIDRVLVATGPGLSLGPAGDGAPKRPVEPWLPFAFDGDDALEALLTGDRLRVFNVMARRGAARGSAAVHRRSAPLPPDATTVLWCVRGRASVRTADGASAALATDSAAEIAARRPPVAGHVSAGSAEPAAHLHIDDADTLVLAATLHV